MYEEGDEQYLRDAVRNPNSYLYRRMCESGPAVTLRLLIGRGFDIETVAFHRLNPVEEPFWTEPPARPNRRQRSLQEKRSQ